MFISLALICLCGMVLSNLMKRLHLPDLLGMLLTGILLGPYVLGLLDPTILQIAPDLRQMALVVILIRAGLGLELNALKKVGRPALLLCFVPALFELIGTFLIAPLCFDLTSIEALLLGAVLAAVSPAVIVPRMLKLIDEGYGTAKSLPQMILAGASVDDIFVIVLFSSFLTMAEGGTFQANVVLEVPVAIGLGILVGIGVGLLSILIFKKWHLRDTSKVLMLLSLGFILVAMEDYVAEYVAFSGLIAIMTMSLVIFKGYDVVAHRLSVRFAKVWVFAQLLLFALVGANLDLGYATRTALPAVLIIIGALVFRALGVFVALLGTPLNTKERLFCVVAYMPKATVQAAIGGVPLAMGLPCGPAILTVAIVSIVVTAPLGAFGIDYLYPKLLQKTS